MKAEGEVRTTIAFPEFYDDKSTMSYQACRRARNRMYYDNHDFNAVIKNFNETQQRFTDTTFVWPEIHHWSDLTYTQHWDDWQSGEDWVRISDMYSNMDKFTLWGRENVSHHDVIQGAIGNCWYVANLAAVAHKPERIKRIFLTEGLNTAGVYAVQLYLLHTRHCDCRRLHFDREAFSR